MRAIEHAVQTLRRGGVVAAATETYFGLLADATQPTAIDRAFALKGRDAGKGVALLVPTEESWETLVVTIPPLAARLAKAFWPGALTIALEARAGVDPRLVVGGSVAVRIPGPSDAADIVAAFGGALTATSANPTGDPPLASDTEVAGVFADALASGELVVVAGAAPGGAPSTIVAVEGETVRLVRAGAISALEVERAVGRALGG